MANEIDDGGPVYPLIDGDLDRITHEGMTQRDLIAAMSMQGILSNPWSSKMLWEVLVKGTPDLTNGERTEIYSETIAELSFVYADAFIKKSKEK